jgi:hypothetical protein
VYAKALPLMEVTKLPMVAEVSPEYAKIS